MFDVSWGEIAVLAAVGVAVTGKRDLPRACRFVGRQVGRVVGLLQGGKARADRFAHHNELRALQNELRSGLRELDRVRTEIAVAASSPVVGKGLGPTTLSANRATTTLSRRPKLSLPPPPPSALPAIGGAAAIPNKIGARDDGGGFRASESGETTPGATTKTTTPPLGLSDFDFQVSDDGDPRRTTTAPAASEEHSTIQQQQQHGLSTAAQSERAAMEEEWTKQGIGFRARAEGGSWIGGDGGVDEIGSVGALDGGGIVGGGDDDPVVADTTRATGSELLEHLERQCLIFDQYDRVVGEQEAEVEERVERIRRNRNERRTADEKTPRSEDGEAASDR